MTVVMHVSYPRGKQSLFFIMKSSLTSIFNSKKKNHHYTIVTYFVTFAMS